MQFHSVADNAFTRFAVAAGTSDNEWVVQESLLDEVQLPFFVDAGREIVEVVGVSEETPVVGQSTWQVVRGVQGTQQAYAVDAPVVQRYYARQQQEIHDAFGMIELYLREYYDGADGVVSGSAGLSLKPVETSPASMSVSINAGVAIVSGRLVGLLTAQPVTLDTVEYGSRTDAIQISSTGVVSVREGESEAAPDNLLLATVTIDDTMTEITGGDITDGRAFLPVEGT